MCSPVNDLPGGLRVAELVKVYAEMVVAYGGVLRSDLAERGEMVRLVITDDLVERLRQAQTGEITISALDIVDRLHGELTREQSGEGNQHCRFLPCDGDGSASRALTPPGIAIAGRNWLRRGDRECLGASHRL